MAGHWLCIATSRPHDAPQPLYPDLRQTAANRSEILLTPNDGAVTAFGPVACSTHRRSPEHGWVNTKHFDQSDSYEALVTDQRLVLSCRNYALAKQSMRFGLVAIALSDKDRSSDNSMMAGHILWKWVMVILARSAVRASPQAPYASEGAYVRLLVQRPAHLGNSTFLVQLNIPTHINHSLVAKDMAERVVRERLARRTESTPEERRAIIAAVENPEVTSLATHSMVKYDIPHALQVS
jgi:hypothetical protein